jgi:hypothetical protein
MAAVRPKLLLLVLLLAGCSHTQVNVGAGSPQAGVQMQVEGGRGFAALLGLSILAAGVYEAERTRYFVNPFVTMSESAAREVPPLAPDRRVSEQDCTRPLDYSLGNIRCK